jgi:hypothetical protein
MRDRGLNSPARQLPRVSDGQSIRGGLGREVRGQVRRRSTRRAARLVNEPAKKVYTYATLPEGQMLPLIPCRAFHAPQGLWLGLLLLSVSAPAAAQPVSFTQFPVPTAASGLSNITMGPDAAVWFTEHNANKIGSITSAGKLTEYSIPTPNAGATGITAGPDGAVWFIESGSNKIARIATSGSIAEYTVPTSAAGLARIVAGRTARSGLLRTAPTKLVASARPVCLRSIPYLAPGHGASRLERTTHCGLLRPAAAPSEGSRLPGQSPNTPSRRAVGARLKSQMGLTAPCGSLRLHQVSAVSLARA